MAPLLFQKDQDPASVHHLRQQPTVGAKTWALVTWGAHSNRKLAAEDPVISCKLNNPRDPVVPSQQVIGDTAMYTFGGSKYLLRRYLDP